ncbi:MAG TPA: N-acetylmuramoyl-L-alanine amidase-like domain-containing protein [Tepidisphaeraceae bacterium]|jgi:hypothetical protein|nr:N-acetylmuramoyl-L-alanine amidase-like domain-containing protein [Tepidisphaeraceae bacterium]
MTTRRTFLRNTVTTTVGILTASAVARAAGTSTDPLNPFKGADIFDRILAKALAGNWQSLPIGQAMGKIAMELKGTPYVGFTLELSKDHEICSVNLAGLDCVTFFEDTLDFARMLKTGGRTPQDLLAQVTLTRYRDGQIGDFTSRLHYTTDWFANNEKKGVVHILAPDLPGSEPFTQKVGIMSEQPNNYRQLKAHPELVAKIHEFENQINAHNAESMKYIPLSDLAAVQSLLQTGDIVGVCTTEPGIDIAHTGLVYQDASGTPHFMDASSSKKNMKVTLESEPISQDFRWSHKLTGAMFARPLEPKSS